ncbi:MAG TPA: hypothetical protein VF999_02805 [Thermoanaerobaculia bacterium]
MTHEEYLSRLDGFTDSPGDVKEVLHHADSCANCRKERRRVERWLFRLDPARRSIAEEVARFAATAALLAIVLLGMHRLSAGPEESEITQPARYRIVGNASGVVAYTPSGIVVGLASNSAEKGMTR